MKRQNTNPTRFGRRSFLRKSISALGAASAYVWCNHPVIAQVSNHDIASLKENVADKKLVWVFLRGAMDGLHAVSPSSDRYLARVRPHLYHGIRQQLLPLNADFGLHPSLKHMHALYKQKQMSPIIAVASGYRERSHFDAQDQMESGLNVTNHDNGWLARALAQRSALSDNEIKGFALDRSLPIAMRGSSANVETWYPSQLPEASPELLSELAGIYQNDDALRLNLAKVIKQKQTPSMQMQEKRRPNFTYLAERCAELINNDEASCAMLELNGWDTHNGQVNRLNRLFAQLDEGLYAMQKMLGENWQNTLVLVSTEFGRTVAANGTNGTDHGTASSMFVLGGALGTSKGLLTGGKVLGKWPGLSSNALYEKRDLMPTSDVRHWLSLALSTHWGLTKTQIDSVFPDLTHPQQV